MKGYSTKYCLTKGIQEVEVGGPPEAGYTGKYRYVKSFMNVVQQLETGITFFTDRDAAEIAAMQAAKRKIRSLEKSLTKMRHLAKKPRWFEGA